MEGTPTPTESKALSRTAYLWIETGVVLLACVLPMIFSSEADVFGLKVRSEPNTFVYHALSMSVMATSQIALVLFIIWRSNDPPKRFGIVPFKWKRDVLGGILLCALLRGFDRLFWWILRISLSYRDYQMLIHSGTGPFYFPPSGPAEFALLALMCAVSGFVQELLMRAYLITRFEELFESKSVAILLSTVLFIGYHGYQGPAGVVNVALFGFVLAIVFCLFRRVVPISLAHAIYNFIAIGRVPWI